MATEAHSGSSAIRHALRQKELEVQQLADESIEQLEVKVSGHIVRRIGHITAGLVLHFRRPTMPEQRCCLLQTLGAHSCRSASVTTCQHHMDPYKPAFARGVCQSHSSCH